MVSKASSEANKEYKQGAEISCNTKIIKRDNNYAFSTIGELRKVPLDSMILDAGVLHSIKEALSNIHGKRRLVQFVGAGEYFGYFTIICTLHERKVGKLKEGKYSAFLYNCDKPELSRCTEIAIKRDWQGNFIWDAN